MTRRKGTALRTASLAGVAVALVAFVCAGGCDRSEPGSCDVVVYTSVDQIYSSDRSEDRPPPGRDPNGVRDPFPGDEHSAYVSRTT